MALNANRPPLAIYVAYTLSGLVSLGYQVAWFRIFVDRFGSTNLTFALVISCFIGGLGAGSLISRSLTDRLGRATGFGNSFRTYGLIELLVAASALITVATSFIPPEFLGPFPYTQQDGIYRLDFIARLVQTAIAVVCILVPCVLMGTTYPLLCSLAKDYGRFPSILYAVNTLGACTGILVCEFILLRDLGHTNTYWLMLIVNAAIGLYFLLRGNVPPQSATEPAPPALQAGAKKTKRRKGRQPESGSSGAAYSYSVLIACTIVSGLLCGGLEGDMFKRLRFLYCQHAAAMSFISFWAILAIFLASTAVSLLPRLRMRTIKLAWLTALGLYALAWYFAVPLREWAMADVYALSEALRSQANPLRHTAALNNVLYFMTSLWSVVLYVGLFVFPPYFLISLLLPFVCNELQKQHKHLGLAYGLNTVAFCVGLLSFSMLAPRVNLFYSLKLGFAFFAIAVGFLLILSTTRPLRGWQPVLAIGAMIAAIVLTPRAFDPGMFDPDAPPARYPVRAVKSDGASTIYVVEDPKGDRLFFDSFSMSGTGVEIHQYMRLMAHLGLLAQPEPKTALLICFGVGNTADAITRHDSIERIDIVDLNHKVFEIAPEFRASNHGAYEDPRVRLIHDDGRSFLRRTDQRYDLITSEPPPPMHEGIYRLYTEEYYRDALEHLTEAGYMTQWLPIYQIPREAVDMMIATFIEVFPHTALFTGYEHEFILVGGKSPIVFDRYEANFDRSPQARADLARYQHRQPWFLPLRLVQGDASLRAHYAADDILHDQHNQLSYLFMDLKNPAIIGYDPLAVENDLAPSRFEAEAHLRQCLHDFGRLRTAVPDFPYTSLNTAADEAPEVRYADANWTAIEELERNAEEAKLNHRPADAAAYYERVLAQVPDYPRIFGMLAQCYLDMGDYARAAEFAGRFSDAFPDEAIGYRVAGFCFMQLDQYADALRPLEQAVAIEPDLHWNHLFLGQAHQALGHRRQAIAAYKSALSLEPTNNEARQALQTLRQNKTTTQP